MPTPPPPIWNGLLWNTGLFGGNKATPAPPPSIPTVQQAILYRALRIGGILNNALRLPSNEQVTEAFNILNESLEGYGAERLLIYNIARIQETLTPGVQDYPIGTGAPAPGFGDMARPSRIENASLLYIEGNTSQPIEIPMIELTVAEWQQTIPLKNVQSTVSYNYWYETVFPYGILHLWPLPQISQPVILYLWQTISQFVTPSDPVNLPVPYKEFIIYDLAMKLNEVWPEYNMKPESIERARDYKHRVKMLNRTFTDVLCDAGIVNKGGGRWDFFTGSWRGSTV